MFRRRNRSIEQAPEVTPLPDPLTERVQYLRDKIGFLLAQDESDGKAEGGTWLPGMREAMVDQIFEGVHAYATVAGIEREDTETRVDLVTAIDAQIRYSNVPNPFGTYCNARQPDFIRSLPRYNAVPPTEEEIQQFMSVAEPVAPQVDIEGS